MYRELEDWMANSQEHLDLQGKFENECPSYVKKDMKKERKAKNGRDCDDTAFVRTLDKDLLENRPYLFVSRLSREIKKGNDDEVFLVIEELGAVSVVVETILKSGNQKYIDKLLERDYFTDEAVFQMLSIGDEKVMVKLASMDISVSADVDIVRMGCSAAIKVIFDRAKLSPSVISAIAELEDPEFNGLLSEYFAKAK